jgi:hypothetical protein
MPVRSGWVSLEFNKIADANADFCCPFWLFLICSALRALRHRRRMPNELRCNERPLRSCPRHVTKGVMTKAQVGKHMGEFSQKIPPFKRGKKSAPGKEMTTICIAPKCPMPRAEQFLLEINSLVFLRLEVQETVAPNSTSENYVVKQCQKINIHVKQRKIGDPNATGQTNKTKALTWSIT